jgi:hypothetical protein
MLIIFYFSDVKNLEVTKRFGRINCHCLKGLSDFVSRNCGEMANSDDSSAQNYESAPTCASGSAIIYAWAMDADKTELPKGKIS